MQLILQTIGMLNVVVSGMALFFVVLLFFSLFRLKDPFIKRLAIAFLIVFSSSVFTNYIMGQSAMSSISNYDLSYLEALLVLGSRFVVVLVGFYILYICYQKFSEGGVK